MKRILVTGSREWTDRNAMSRALFNLWLELDRPRDVVLVHGAARGADTLAAEVWAKQGFPVEAHPADWRTFGKAAGYLRNDAMVQAGADLCLGFLVNGAGNRGTRHCIGLAKNAGIPVRTFTS